MDFNRNMRNPYRRGSFTSVVGVIVDMVPTMVGNRRADGCMVFMTVEDVNGNLYNFIVTPSTYVLDFVTLSEGMQCTFWYRNDAPAPLIYPPQYNAAVIARNQNERNVDVSFYNLSMINEEQTLKINLDDSVELLTTNNQQYQGNPFNHDLVVVYENSTRSIPAQTTPQKIIVLCNNT